MKWLRPLAGGLALSLLLVFVGFAAPAYASWNIYPNPAPGAVGIKNSQLPSCSSISGTKANEMAGQGWIGDRGLPTAAGLRNGAAFLMLPCWTPGSTGGPQVFTRIWVTSDAGTYIALTNQIQITFVKYTCNGADRIDTNVPYSYSGGIPNGTLATWTGGANTAPSFCTTGDSVLTKIQINWKTLSDSLGSINGTATWTPSAWTDGTPITRPSSLGQVPMPNGSETPILCPYTINSATVLDALSSFFITFGPWWLCLFTPSGWDRSQQIPASFELGGISRSDDIINSVLPTAGSVFCGDIMVMSLGWLNYTMNNCAAAAAVPTWIKVAIATVSIIAMLFLFIRRIQWTVLV